MGYGFGQLNNYTYTAHKIAKAKGFWAEGEDGAFDDTRRMLSYLMLVTTEVAEAAEAVRHGDLENFKEELADICIRVFDLSEALNLNLEQEIVNKMIKNEKRPKLHGKRA